MRFIWTEEKINLSIELLKKGFNYLKISKHINGTESSIRCKLNKLGYKFSDFQKINKKCLNCEKEFETRISSIKKFCNNSCSATYNNKLKVKIKNFCLNCDKEINKDLKFCCIPCFSSHHKKEKIRLIESGDTSFSSRIFKWYLIEKHGNKCMECDWAKTNPKTGLVPIQLEHIDGNSDNNTLSNLKLLCPNCHSLTPTFGFLNHTGQTSKRKEYRKRYREK